MSKHTNRTKKIDIRLTPREYFSIEEEFNISPYIYRSTFIRAKLFERRIGEIEQRKHQAFLEAAKLFTELNRLGNNFNQVVHAINTYKVVELTPAKLKTIQDLGQKLDTLLELLDDLYL